jgi:mycothiol synthase
MQSAQQDAPHKRAFKFTLRPLVESDAEAYIAYSNECASLEKAMEPITLDKWLEWHHNPMNNERITLAFLQNEDGSEARIIGEEGFNIRPPDTRAWGWMHVHPDYRLNGVGTALYDEYLRLAKEAGATIFTMTPSREAPCLIEFARRRGHELERWFWDMRLPAEQEVPPAAWPEGITSRTFIAGQDEELFTHVRNVTFAEHYGSVQRTVEEMSYLTRMEHFDPNGLFFAFEGDRIAGFCFTGRDPREWEARGEKLGHINLLGVMPDYRGRSVGRALLVEGVNYLRRFVPIVELGVEGKNEKALALYESVGFHQHKAWANMPREEAPSPSS